MILFAYAFPCFQTKLDKKLVQHKQTRETHIMFQTWISYRLSANIGHKISVIRISVNFHIGPSLLYMYFNIENFGICTGIYIYIYIYINYISIPVHYLHQPTLYINTGTLPTSAYFIYQYWYTTYISLLL